MRLSMSRYVTHQLAFDHPIPLGVIESTSHAQFPYQIANRLRTEQIPQITIVSLFDDRLNKSVGFKFDRTATLESHTAMEKGEIRMRRMHECVCVKPMKHNSRCHHLEYDDFLLFRSIFFCFSSCRA